jgi:threonine efflux protein
MTSLSILATTVFAGAIYCITPGPAVLALFGIGASQGRRAAAAFLAGHFVGDVLWGTLALVAIIGAQSVGAVVFDVLGLLCGGYLFWLGWKALSAKRRADGVLDIDVRRPLIRGMLFGVTNPKGYPVAVATFTALLAGTSGDMGWADLPLLLVAACLGFIIGYGVLVLFIGLGVVRRFYRRHEIWVVRASGLLFIGFAVHAIWKSVSDLAFALPSR